MTPDELRDIQARAKAELAKIDTAHTEENENRLRAEFERRGWKLTRSGSGKSGFTLVDPGRTRISGLTLADAQNLFKKIAKS
ncbi:hypothetical protein HRJ34_21125 [Rhizorhabdus wittichii]|uniref:Uncharacterized protein n=1 Tax=Rhizorhabdus wittichii TaxID=160791 RepID=A0A975D327_9SPHN|nr:hypothetical protein [Rhizorhabdus wittichii]QTH20800.1 hypothetical protein HRJ34_21125 [Rhizorhabdus wittichii]